MTLEELQARYKRIYKTLLAERAQRVRVFAVGHPKRQKKLGEIDQALEDLIAIKDFAKSHADPPVVQASLLGDQGDQYYGKGG